MQSKQNEPGSLDILSVADLFKRREEALRKDPKRKSPFKFLDPYGPDDKDIFFGRDLEIAELYSRFYKNRLLIVYGESGAGKTSLIQCGLRSKIPSEDAVFFTIRSKNDPLDNLRNELLKNISFHNENVPDGYLELLKEAFYIKCKTLVLVFDQFEEFFIFQSESIRNRFKEELTRWINSRLDVNIIICIREEYLARLTELESPSLPLYQNKLWIRRMSREQANEVIRKPCLHCGVDIEDKLVDELLGKFTQGGKGVELPILQVVLDRLYCESVKKPSSGVPVLTISSYKETGEIQTILEDFINETLSSYNNEEQIKQILKTFVTKEGTNRACSLPEIKESVRMFKVHINEVELDTIIKGLVDKRIIREQADNQFYELRHDCLAQTIYKWMTGIEKDVIEIRQTVENRFREYTKYGTLLDAKTIQEIVLHEDRLSLRSELREFLLKSKKELGRKKKTMLVVYVSAIAVFLCSVSILAILSFYKSIDAKNQLINAQHNIGLVYNEKAENALKYKDFNTARLYSLLAIANFKNKGGYREKANAWTTVLSHPVYPIIFSTTIAASDGKKNSIHSTAYSPDGRCTALGLDDGTIKLLDITTGSVLITLNGHSHNVTSLGFSPDGKTLASGSADNTIKLWDITSGKVLITLKGHTDGVSSVSFSPDGTIIASGACDFTVKLWKTTTGSEITTLKGHSDEVSTISFSSDGKVVASGSEDNTIKLWDIATGKVFATLKGHDKSVKSASFSPDGKVLASGSEDCTIRLWNTATGKEITTLKGHNKTVNSVSFSPDGKILASGSEDCTIKLWNTATGVELASIRGHSDGVSGVSFSPDGRNVLSSSRDSTLKLWDVNTGNEFVTLKGHSWFISSVIFSPDGKTVVSGAHDSTIKLWDLELGKVLNTLKGHSGFVSCVRFSPDGKTVASGSGDNTIKLWDIVTGKEIATLKEHDKAVNGISFSPDGKILASGSEDCTIKLWNIVTGKVLSTLNGHDKSVNSVTFSPDGKILASVSEDCTIKLWNIVTGKVLSTLNGHDKSVNSVTFSPDGKILASGSKDCTIKLWDIATRKEIVTLKGHFRSVNSVCFGLDGKIVVSGSDDNTVKLWDVATRSELAALVGHSMPVASVVISSNDKIIASGSWDNTIKFWNVAPLFETSQIQQIINKAKHDYHLELDGLALKPISNL